MTKRRTLVLQYPSFWTGNIFISDLEVDTYACQCTHTNIKSSDRLYSCETATFIAPDLKVEVRVLTL